MIESWPYRKELARYARSFDSRRKRQVWREDSLAKAERMFYVGFLFVRKLIECRKVSDACCRSSTSVSRAHITRSREVSAFRRDDLFKDLDAAVWRAHRIDSRQLADNAIHAWWIVPIQNDHGGLEGFAFTTERQRNSELWLVSTEAIVEVFHRFSKQAIREIRAQRNDVGQLTYWRAE